MGETPLLGLPGFPFTVQASRGAEAHAREVATMVADARRWLSDMLAVPEPTTHVLLLSPEHWDEFCPVPFFGVPYSDETGAVMIGHGRAAFATELVERARPHLSPARQAAVEQAFGEPADATPYLDCVAVHEVAHNLQSRDGWHFPRFWLYELFPQLAMVGYVASRAPGRLAPLHLFHDVSGAVPMRDLPLSALDDMEGSLAHGAWLYCWYELRLGALAEQMWDLAGPDSLRRLFTEFRDPDMTEELILRAMGGIHPDLPGMLKSWPRFEPAPGRAVPGA